MHVSRVCIKFIMDAVRRHACTCTSVLLATENMLTLSDLARQNSIASAALLHSIADPLGQHNKVLLARKLRSLWEKLWLRKIP